MEVADLSELCRLCLDSSHVLFPFESTLLSHTKRTIPQLIKFCLDIDCNSNDDGIAPKNLCQACLDKLQACFEFKIKSQESDKYLKQIISHSTQQEEIQQPAEPTPFNSSYPDDEDSLLQPLDDYDEPIAERDPEKDVLKKGQRTGDFVCKICYKSFKYVKPLRTHMKLHQKAKLAAASFAPKQGRGRPKKYQNPKKEPQPAYDSISPYNSPAPYDNETSNIDARDSSPDFGALMLSTSQMIGDEVSDEEVPRTLSGRPLKRPAAPDTDYTPNGTSKRTRTRNSAPPKPSPAPSRVPAKSSPAPSRIPARVRTPVPVKSPESSKPKPGPLKSSEPPKSKPGPLSKTRSKPEQKKNDEEFTIEGFCEVDITKVLKKSKKSSTSMIEMVDDDSQKSSVSSSRSRASRSPSVELIQEFDIFH